MLTFGSTPGKEGDGTRTRDRRDHKERGEQSRADECGDVQPKRQIANPRKPDAQPEMCGLSAVR